MSGLLYSQDSNGFRDLTVLKRRGKDACTELQNELGYFHHCLLDLTGAEASQPMKTSHGYALLDGGSYNCKSCSKFLRDNLDGNLSNTLDCIRGARGEFALVYVTERHIVFCVDTFGLKNLWFFHDQSTRQLTLSSIPRLVEQKHGNSWQADGNKIYIVDKHDWSVDIQENHIFNLDQKIKHFDYVFEQFENAVQDRYQPEHSTLLLSSGMDSGALACAINKLFGELDCVSDPEIEDKEVIKQRMAIHKAVILPPVKDLSEEDKDIMLKEIIGKHTLWHVSVTDGLINLIKNYVYKNKKKIVITGEGTDALYTDRMGEGNGTAWSKTNQKFPNNLSFVWPWYNLQGKLQIMNTRNDFIAGYYQAEARSPMLDLKLVQAWLNTTADCKNDKKSWIRQYMDLHKYPYTLEKIHSWSKEIRNPCCISILNTMK